MNKRAILLGVACILISVLVARMHTLQAWLLCIQYLTMAYGIALVAYAWFQKRTKEHLFVYAIGVVIVVSFTLLTIDTFLVHAISWFPGIIRYPLYSLYGWPYLAFLIPGFLLSFHSTTRQKAKI